MLKELKSKVRNGIGRVKEVVADNKELVIYAGTMVGVIGVSVVCGRRNKRYQTAWRNAKQAFEAGQLDTDFGPYKLMKFFEPTTGDFIGQTMIHEDSVEQFLKFK